MLALKSRSFLPLAATVFLPGELTCEMLSRRQSALLSRLPFPDIIRGMTTHSDTTAKSSHQITLQNVYLSNTREEASGLGLVL